MELAGLAPDGYVAWRSVDLPADPLGALVDALGRVSSAVRRSQAPVPDNRAAMGL